MLAVIVSSSEIDGYISLYDDNEIFEEVSINENDDNDNDNENDDIL